MKKPTPAPNIPQGLIKLNVTTSEISPETTVLIEIYLVFDEKKINPDTT